MFWNRSKFAELDPAQVQSLLHRGDVHLVDVREPHEHAAESIEGAVCMPMSRFDPKALPQDPRTVVLHCLSGSRSALAASLCLRAGIAVQNMKGGIAAWKAHGLPTRRRGAA